MRRFGLTIGVLVAVGGLLAMAGTSQRLQSAGTQRRAEALCRDAVNRYVLNRMAFDYGMYKTDRFGRGLTELHLTAELRTVYGETVQASFACAVVNSSDGAYVARLAEQTPPASEAAAGRAPPAHGPIETVSQHLGTPRHAPLN